MAQSIFVCGATGTQGGATARQLLQSGATVHALARDPSSAKAQELKTLGVKLWHGDFDNEEALKAAIAGTSAVFMNFMPDFTDFGANLRQANLILRTARDAGTVRQVVYSSGVGGADLLKSPLVQPGSMVALVLQSKADIEEVVRASDLGSWTVLRPANFMANYVNPLAAMQLMGLAETGRWSTANQETDLIPLVDTLTIGRFSAAALLEPERFNGKTVTYADEVVPMGDIIKRLAEMTGRDLQMVPLSAEEIETQKVTNPFIGGQLLMRGMHKYFNPEEVKSWGLPLSTFDEFLKREKRAVDETYLAPQGEKAV